MSVTSNQEGVGGHIQIVRRLVDVIQAEDIGVINQLHKHNLALNPEHDLLLLFTGVGYGHTAGDERLLGDNLNGSALFRLDMLCNLDAPCCVVSARALLCMTTNDNAPDEPLPIVFPISQFPTILHSPSRFERLDFLWFAWGKGEGVGSAIVGACLYKSKGIWYIKEMQRA